MNESGLYVPEVFEALAPFVRKEGGKTFEALLQRPFKPKGLMAWDVGSADIELALVGTDAQLLVSWGPIPARWFSAWESFALVAKAVSEGKEPPGWGTWRAVEPGVLIRVIFDRPMPEETRLLMWGEV